MNIGLGTGPDSALEKCPPVYGDSCPTRCMSEVGDLHQAELANGARTGSAGCDDGHSRLL